MEARHRKNSLECRIEVGTPRKVPGKERPEWRNNCKQAIESAQSKGKPRVYIFWDIVQTLSFPVRTLLSLWPALLASGLASIHFSARQARTP
eukprot:708074-Pleurochrysis_carterae.AAC.2